MNERQRTRRHDQTAVWLWSGCAGFEVDRQLELGWPLDRDIGCFGAREQFDDLLRHHLYKEWTKARSMGGKGTFLRLQLHACRKAV